LEMIIITSMTSKISKKLQSMKKMKRISMVKRSNNTTKMTLIMELDKESKQAPNLRQYKSIC